MLRLSGPCLATLAALLLPCLIMAPTTASAAPAVDPDAVHLAATNARSVHLDAPARVRLADSFHALVSIPGGSRSEHAIRDECQRRLATLGARTIPVVDSLSNAPVNLAMRLDGVGALSNHPALLLNAHLDTLVVSTPQHLAFDPATGDFFHGLEADRAAITSFGGDDRSGLVVVLEALRHLHLRDPNQPGPRTPIVVLLTGSEEIGLVGAKHLARHHPRLFENIGLSITIDGPLDYETAYPSDRLVAVVSDSDAKRQPYAGILGLLAAHASAAKVGWSRSEVGLGKGDFAAFPAHVRPGLHFRSPVRGWHRRERVQVQDLVHHVDLLIDVIQRWPEASAP